MFLVHFDDREVTFCASHSRPKKGEEQTILTGLESAKELSRILIPFTENKMIRSASFFSADLNKTWETFCSLYISMDAAGGIVLNKEQKLLMIYRNERWDLPKGKIEEGEKRTDAAMREVTEETGVGKLKIDHECNTTYHVYPFKNKNILKRTYWYRMNSEDKNAPQPQTAEGITMAVWMDEAEVKQAAKFAYLSVVNLLKAESLL